jgi:hypothetical protein
VKHRSHKIATSSFSAYKMKSFQELKLFGGDKLHLQTAFYKDRHKKFSSRNSVQEDI